MAKITNFQSLVKENFPSKYSDLLDVIGTPFNNLGQQVVNLLNNNQVTVTDNLNMQYKTLTVTVDSNGKPLQSLTYLSTLSTKTQGLIVVSAVNLTNSTVYPTGQPFCSWADNSKTVTISNITGLPANNQFQLTVLATG